MAPRASRVGWLGAKVRAPDGHLHGDTLRATLVEKDGLCSYRLVLRTHRIERRIAAEQAAAREQSAKREAEEQRRKAESTKPTL